ncbi:MAG: hypothetical protein M3Y53_03625 [Thermoproteota archaeon]|nr:hypothetical protein [Thermoproteota archaeon]
MKLKGMIGIQNRLSMDNAFEGKNGIVGLIDPPAVLYGTTEIGNNKNIAYEFTPKNIKIAILCDGSRANN